MINIIGNALLAGLAMSIISGPIGSLIMWQRMTHFGDALGHATLLGICVATIINVNLNYGLIITCLIIAILLTIFSNKSTFTNDTSLSILSHSIFALGLIMATVLNNNRVDLIAYLCGDILSITQQDLMLLGIIDVIVIGSLWYLWDKLMLVIISPELAAANNFPVATIRWAFVLLLALIFAGSVRLMGVLLINTLLIIPCAAAKVWANGPIQMAIGGSMLSLAAIILGIISSFIWDIPSGPTIVICSSVLFIISMVTYKIISLYTHYIAK